MPELSRLIEATYAGDYRVNLKFSDGVAGCVDFSDMLQHSFYVPLRDKQLFAQVKVNDEVHVLQWPGDIDMAPEITFERALQAAGKNK